MTAAGNKTILRTITSLLIVILFCPFAYGKVIYVDKDGQADFDNIQAGIDAADDGDMVLVALGEYVITEPITFRGKAITVKSEAGPEQTIIRMGTPTDTNRGSVVVFESNETVESILDGFTITGGRGIFEPSLSVWGGGGILFKTSSGIVRNCTIVQNTADDGGGVTVFSESSASLRNCIIRENLSTGGSGGVCCWDNSSVTMNYCTIAENTANVGGGVFGGENSHITMSHCAIINNNAYTGSGGMETWHQSSADVTNCLIAWNTASGLGGGGVNCSIQGSATIINSIIWGNTAPKGREIWVRDAGTLSISYSDVAGGQAETTVEGGTLNWSRGNIDADPLFADPDNDDFHLKSNAGRWDPNSQSWVQDDVTSPCIDAGDPLSPVMYEPYPNGGIINMGAYGGTAEASKSPSGLHAKYGGGTGKPNDPYQIATAEDLILLGESTEDYDKHFIMIADIDLDPNLPGRKVFDKAVIAWDDVGGPFTGVFDGNNHTISHLTIRGEGYLGLFGRTGAGASISNLGLEAVDVNGTGDNVGGLVGFNRGGSITSCYSTGAVNGDWTVGGLVGWNNGSITSSDSTASVSGGDDVGGLVGENGWGEGNGSITNSYSTGTVNGNDGVGGLVGCNGGRMGVGSITNSYSTGAVTGIENVGGLVGDNRGSSITSSYSTGTVAGIENVGGLVGENRGGSITTSYSTGSVSGNENVGGLVGSNVSTGIPHIMGCVESSFWDIQTSGQTNMCGYKTEGSISCDDSYGRITAEMQTESTFTDVGWDFVDETENGTEDIWWIDEGQDYPRLWWELISEN